MPAWDSSTPYRTGIPTARAAVQAACVILIKFQAIIIAHLEPSRHVYVSALVQACEDFIANVPSPRPD